MHRYAAYLWGGHCFNTQAALFRRLIASAALNRMQAVNNQQVVVFCNASPKSTSQSLLYFPAKYVLFVNVPFKAKGPFFHSHFFHCLQDNGNPEAVSDSEEETDADNSGVVSLPGC